MQSRAHSFLEATLNTASGFVVSLVAGHFLFPVFGVAVSLSQNVGLTCAFTVLSIARSYVWRRIFNKRAVR